MNFDYLQVLRLLAPQAILVIGVLLVLFLDQALSGKTPVKTRNLSARIVAICSCVLASVWIWTHPENGRYYQEMLVITGFTQIVQQALIWLTIFTIVIARADEFTAHIGEFFSLVLLGAVGLTLMVATEELLVAFVSLELTSLTLYILAAFNKRSIHSAEGALKYFLVGSSAAAFTLFGISLIYGLSGSTSFATIALSLRDGGAEPALLLAIVLVGAGFGFKVAAVPFHLWAPDAYQGAPAPSAAFIASGSKLASFFLFAKIFILSFPEHGGSAGWGSMVSGWTVLLAVLALASMLFGNLTAIVQSNFRRLLAYSAIAHAGYALLAVMSGTAMGLSALVYYMFTYSLAAIGLFGVVQAIERENGQISLGDFAGLRARSPLLAFCLAIFVLSLAGIPPLAGFFGKFYVFIAALKAPGAEIGLLWLVVVAVLTSAISLYYYLQVLKQAFVVEGSGGGAIAGVWPIALLALGVVVLGCAPDLLLGPVEAAIQAELSIPASGSLTSVNAGP